MSRFFVFLLSAALLVVSMDADARRFGGGRSFGRQSPNVTQRQAAPPPSTPAPAQAGAQNAAARPGAAAAGTAAAAKRPWGGMLGGLAAGLGLAWLAHSLGLGEAFGNILLIALLAMAALFAFRFFMRSRGANANRSGLAYQGQGGVGGASAATPPASYNPGNVGNDASARPWESQNATFDAQQGADAPASEAGRRSAGSVTAGAAVAGGVVIGSALTGSQSWGVPAGFDVDGFVTAAKRNFVSLQEAWDQADMQALKSMMTDGMVQEIQAQLAERESHTGAVPNKTDVVMLEAQLLGIEETPDAYMASIEFSGMIREDASAGPSPFREVWNMTRPVNGKGGWLVAGVQALQ